MPILIAVSLTAATPVLAQVTVDLHALQALPAHPPAGRPVHAFPLAAPPAARSVAVGKPAPVTHNAAEPATPARAQAAPVRVAPVRAAPVQAARPAMPENVPDVATISPIAPPEPPAGSAPPPASGPSAASTSATTAVPAAAGLRVTFAPGQSELSPASLASIKALTAGVPTGDDITFDISAYAPGKPDDPSTARRTSLSRAMAVRGALIADGIQSAQIFVRALGERYGDGPPDRVDIGVTGTNSPSSSATVR